MNSFRTKLDAVLRYTIAFLMAGMVINVVWQVLTRFVFPTPSSFTDELARYSMIWLGLLGAAYCSGQKSHLALDLVPMNLTGARRRWLEIFIQVTILGFAAAVLVGGGGRLVWISWELGQTSAALQIKLAYVYLALPITGVLIAFYAVLDLFAAIRSTFTAAHSSGDIT
ncbi:MAG TPA: TRAP transporter small permease [Opitutus sp.]|nr:TRAP transporter small permease [Opitutus sp.]